jgi:hypothetical protein
MTQPAGGGTILLVDDGHGLEAAQECSKDCTTLS